MEFTPEQYRAMRFQLDRAEEQALRAGRAVDWLIDPTDLQAELQRPPTADERRFAAQPWQHSAFAEVVL
jgi:hypothetical protein